MMPAMFCSRCGAQLVPNAAFCSKCGAPVVAASAPATVPPPAAEPAAPAPPPLSSSTPRIFDTPSAASGTVVITRPAIITVLAVLHLVGGAFWLLVGLGGLVSTASGDMAAALVAAPVFLAIGVAQLFCGIGLLKLKPYGRTLQLVFAWIGLIAIPVGTIISILILIYLFKPGIKLIFAGRPGDDFTDQELAEIKADTTNSGAMIAVIVIVSIISLVMAIAIIAAIAVPGFLRARTAGNEATAISSLRAVIAAEVEYAASCGQGGFAVTLEDLAKPPASRGRAFISADLGRSDTEKSGYIITLTRDRSPLVGDVGTAAATCNASAGQPASSYFATAQPVTPGSTGLRYFAVDGQGTIYESTRPIPNPIMNSTDIVPIR